MRGLDLGVWLPALGFALPIDGRVDADATIAGSLRDPTVDTDSPEYREVFATEAKTPNQAVAKVRPLADGRRLRAYLATGTYKHELTGARWVA